MAYENILVERLDGGVGLVRLNRPRAFNALNRATLLELVAALDDFDSDPALGCVVLTGSDKAFAAGADIKEMATASAVDMMAADTIGLYDRVGAHHKPLIAAVSGWALGGGAELAMICDMIVASETAKFGQPEVTIGVIPGAGGTQRLTRAVGKALAMEMVLNNRQLSADEAARLGLVNHVYPVETYLDEALRIAREIAARAPLAVRLAKEAINRAFETPLSDGIAHERRSFYLLFATEDQKEGMAAFGEKRAPAWKGK
ncbi:MAG: enoyl-CoA hydratase/isomerase family protein [Anaerolineae bacterium]|nr:enoyl-CoA hydratase/isomerase family protein [Anaerolineae bacterium]